MHQSSVFGMQESSDESAQSSDELDRLASSLPQPHEFVYVCLSVCEHIDILSGARCICTRTMKLCVDSTSRTVQNQQKLVHLNK